MLHVFTLIGGATVDNQTTAVATSLTVTSRVTSANVTTVVPTILDSGASRVMLADKEGFINLNCSTAQQQISFANGTSYGADCYRQLVNGLFWLVSAVAILGA